MQTPLAAYSLRVRARLLNHPGVLGQLITVLGAAGGNLMAIDIVATDGATVTRDLVVFCPSESRANALTVARSASGRSRDSGGRGSDIRSAPSWKAQHRPQASRCSTEMT